MSASIHISNGGALASTSSAFGKAEAERQLRLIAGGTALQMADFLENTGGFIAEMNRWTGQFIAADRPVRSDDAGLAAGRILLCYLVTRDPRFLEWATRIVDGIEAASAGTGRVHESMDLYYGLCWGANITGSSRWREAALVAARDRIAAYWSESAGCFVIPLAGGSIDAIEGLGWRVPTLAWAAKHDSGLARYLIASLDRVLDVGLVRDDGSSYHVAEYDRNHSFTGFATYQGYSVDSTWARGQAWGMHGFLAGWEATGERRFLDAAMKMADWWITRTGIEAVPFYDFDDPHHFDIPRDTCAAAIAADVLLRLARAAPVAALKKESYLAAAEATLAELIRNHISPGGVVLHGSSGNPRDTIFGQASSRLPPDRAPDVRTHRFPMEEIMPFGQMFIASALYRRMADDWSLIDL